MARYSVGFTSAAAATAAALFSIKTAASERARIWEIGIFQPGTGTATVVAGGFGQAANSGSVAGTAQAGLKDDPADGASTVNVYAAWTTAPTVPAAFYRRFSLPATLGAGVIFTFPLGLVIPVSADYCLWNNGGTTALALPCYITWDE
jgi:hypothetical protein